jgi:hypothetical protein
MDTIYQISQLDPEDIFKKYETLFSRRIERLQLKLDKSK